MATSIDSLDIQISAKATSANNAINRLTKNLDKLSTSLNSLNVGNVKGLDKTLKSLANISNVSSNGATNITNLARALATLSTNANNIPVLNRSLSGLSGSLARFMATMSVAPSVNSNTLQMTQALAQLSRAGNNASVTASNLANLGTQLRNFMQIMSTAPMVNQNTIQMTNALANLASQGSRVGRSSQSLVSGLNRTDKAIRTSTKSAWSLARAFGKFYANYFLIIRGAKALWGSIESTADYIEAYNYYNVAFGKIASEWKQDFAKFGYDNAEEYAESFTGRMNETLGKLSGVQISVGADGKGLLTDTGMKNLGLNIQEITQYASQLASVTNSLGQTSETSLAISTSFTKLAGDISSLFNVDYSTVSKNLQSGLIGQSRALYKYGIDITNASLQTKAYELGLTKAVSEMTQMEKQQLRTLVILEESKIAYGDLANTINSPSNMIRQFKNNLSETSMVLGQLFIPVLENVLPIANGTAIAIRRLITEIAGFFGVKINLEEYGQGYNQLEDETGDLSDSYDDLANSVKEAQNQFLSFDDANKLSDTSATLSVGTEDNTIDLTDEIVSATEEYQKVWDEAFANMENTSQKWADTIGSAFDTLADYLEPITDFSSENLENFYNSFLKPLGSWTLGTGLPQLAEIFDDFMDDVDWDDLADDLNKFYKGVEPFAEGFGQGFLYFVDGLTDIGSGAINLIGDALGVFGITLQNIDPDIVEGIGTALGILVPVILSMKAVDGIDKILDTAGTGIFNFVKSIANHPYAATAIGITTLTAAIVAMYDDFIENTEEGQINARAEELSGAMESLSTNLSNTLAGIDGKYQYYEDMAKDYLELSGKYDTLSEDDKNLVKQYADELESYSGEIAGYINDITGEWEGTNAQLLQAIKNTKDYYKTQAYEKQKVGYYEAIAEAEIGLQDLEVVFEDGLQQELLEIVPDNMKHLVENIDISSGYLIDYLEGLKTANYRNGALNDRIQEVVDAYRTYEKVIEQSENSIKSVDELISKTSKNSSNTITNTVNEDIDTIEELWDELTFIFTGKNNNMQKDMANTSERGKGYFASLVNYANNVFNMIDSPQIDVDTSKGVGNTINSVSRINSILAGIKQPIINTNTNNAITNSQNTVTKINSIFTGVKTINPTVDDSSATSGFFGVLTKFNQIIGNPVTKVKVETDETSLSGFMKHLKEVIEGTKITVGASVSGAAGGLALALGIQKRAMGGFVDEGQLFIAREAGPELVGSMGGRTAVANNQQITDGIARAVYSAFTSALSTTNRGSSGDIVINIDGKQVFKVVQRQANNYVAQTGQSPFNI